MRSQQGKRGYSTTSNSARRTEPVRADAIRRPNCLGLHQHRDAGRLKVLVNEDAANAWPAKNDPEGVAFEYDVMS
jgi:hypothetical protein